jgi:hypothetical protein
VNWFRLFQPHLKLQIRARTAALDKSNQLNGIPPPTIEQLHKLPQLISLRVARFAEP